jgi:RNA polymerase sigma-70 factor (ECF subfamily)
MQEGDLDLWSRVKDDDEKAFEMLFRKYFYTLCLLSKRYTNDLTTSREVIQDLFINLWEKRKTLSISTSLRTYLASSARFNSIRRAGESRKLVSISESVHDYPEELIDHLEYAELQSAILEAIEKLPDQCKKVFIMSRFEMIRHSDIASQLNISIKTVEAHIGKALKLMHQALDVLYLIFLIVWIKGLF